MERSMPTRSAHHEKIAMRKDLTGPLRGVGVPDAGLNFLASFTPRCAEAIRDELADAQNIDPDHPIFGRFDFHQEWDDEKKGGLFGRALTMTGIDRHGL